MPTGSMNFTIRRAGNWLPAATFLAFSLIVLAAAPDVGSKVFYAFMTLFSGYWLMRAWSVGVELNADGLVVRELVRTRRFRWEELRRASTNPMRTVSPLSQRFPYVALALELGNGRVHQFDAVSRSVSRRSEVDAIVDAINRRL